MKIASFGAKWDAFRQGIINHRKRRRMDLVAKADRTQERSIHLLQQRYGFTREEATLQLSKYYSKARLG